MPIYSFKCKNCDTIFEYITSFEKIKKIKCTKCKSKKIERLLGNHNINMNGVQKSEDNPISGIARMAEYADRKTGKKLGYGPIESVKGN